MPCWVGLARGQVRAGERGPYHEGHAIQSKANESAAHCVHLFFLRHYAPPDESAGGSLRFEPPQDCLARVTIVDKHTVLKLRPLQPQNGHTVSLMQSGPRFPPAHAGSVSLHMCGEASLALACESGHEVHVVEHDEPLHGQGEGLQSLVEPSVGVHPHAVRIPSLNIPAHDVPPIRVIRAVVPNKVELPAVQHLQRKRALSRQYQQTVVFAISLCRVAAHHASELHVLTPDHRGQGEDLHCVASVGCGLRRVQTLADGAFDPLRAHHRVRCYSTTVECR
mmetsp:Transcript_25928/g.66731  ORF Transcript_25928/g.66731 Transcript_25928/m.66731 type:complete len:279 (-) Transcript_25928:1306-2142(-)